MVVIIIVGVYTCIILLDVHRTDRTSERSGRTINAGNGTTRSTWPRFVWLCGLLQYYTAWGYLHTSIIPKFCRIISVC